MSPTIVPTLVGLAALFPALSPGPKLDPSLEGEVQARVAVIQQWAADPIVVSAVREANASLRNLDDIAGIDARWQRTSGIDDFMRTLIEHPAAARLRELRESSPELQEAFVTDRLGANVACTNKTSDFYQGDEEKFQKAFAGGKGGVHVGDLERDESIQSYSVPVGVPVLDAGAAIGVLVVTVNVERLRPARTP